MQAPRMADDHTAPKGTRAAEKENDVMAANRKPRYATLDDGADAVRRASRRRSTSPTEVRRRAQARARAPRRRCVSAIPPPAPLDFV